MLKFHVDSDSQHWIWYYLMHFMLTGTNNRFTVSCWLGLENLILLSNDIFYVDWGSLHYIISISCWLNSQHWLWYLRDIFYADRESQHYHYFMLTWTHNDDHMICSMLTGTHNIIFNVDFESEHWAYFHNKWFMLTGT